MSTDEDKMMLKLWLLMAIAISTSPSVKVMEGCIVIEDGMIVIFDNKQASEDRDARHCRNAVVDPNILSQLKHKIRSKHDYRIKSEILSHFFQRGQWNYNTIGHAIYHGRAVFDFCESDDLIVIHTVQ
jgi:hypothetical protein